MSANDLVLLDQALAEVDGLRSVPLAKDIAFELFSAEQIMRDYNLSPEEIESGRIGGGKDGAIDSVYVLLGDRILREDDDLFDSEASANKYDRGIKISLWLIQSKTTPSFTETALDLIESSTQRLLNLQETEGSLKQLYSDDVVAKLGVFRLAWKKLATRQPILSIDVRYATRGVTGEVNERVTRKARDLQSKLEVLVSGADVSVKLVGASQLWDAFSKAPSYDMRLVYQENATSGSSHVAVVKLSDYFIFLKDDNGNLKRHVFDSNVRDYQGDVEVNIEIENALKDPQSPDFWWLNNGVTIICNSAIIVGKEYILSDVQIVNGLQSSYTVFNFFAENPALTAGPVGDRSILVRILTTDDPETRDQVIRATNRQTSVNPASLRATDELQRKIERFFLSKDWYYDRRKNYYKNLGKKTDRIVSISYLAQSVMAIGLSRPDYSRARPSSLLKKEADYSTVFNRSTPLQTYLWVLKVQRSVDDYLSSGKEQITATEKTNLHFQVSMLAIAKKVGQKVYGIGQIRELAEADTVLAETEISEALAEVRKCLRGFLATRKWTSDRAAKSREFTEHIISTYLKT